MNWVPSFSISLRIVAAMMAIHFASARAQLTGHGGPVRAISVFGDGNSVLSGSFDTAAIRWSLKTESAEQVLRFHSDAVNAVAFLKDGRMATAGADAKIAIWTPGRQQPDRVFEGHVAPIVSLAVSPDGARLASASWDHTVRIWSLSDGAQQVLEGHSQNVNAVAFTPDGRSLVSVGYDRELRIWPLAGGTPSVITLAAPLNAVAVAPDGEIVTGGADGKIRRWNARTGEPVGSSLQATPRDPLAAYAGDHGAEVFRACVACHTLSEKDAQRAGPTLAGLYGRRIASLPGYRFSDALKGMDIIWTPETVSKLFEFGPNAYTPGTKMPEQRIGSAADRKALTDFLGRATSK